MTASSKRESSGGTEAIVSGELKSNTTIAGRMAGTTETSSGDAWVLSNYVLDTVAKDVPADHWRPIVRYLCRKDSTQTDIEQIEERYPKNLKEQKYQALLMWKTTSGQRATLSVLQKALRANSCSHIADTLPAYVAEDIYDTLDNIINPKGLRTPQKTSFDSLASEFNKRHGKFKGHGVGSLKEFLTNSNRFKVIEKKGRESIVEQICHEFTSDVIKNQDRKAKVKGRIQLDDSNDMRQSPTIPLTGKAISHPTDDTGAQRPLVPQSPPSLVEGADQKIHSFLEDVKAARETPKVSQTDSIPPLTSTPKRSSFSFPQIDRLTHLSADFASADEMSRHDPNKSCCSTVESSSYRASPTSDVQAWFDHIYPPLEAEVVENNIPDLLQKTQDDTLAFRESASVYLSEGGHIEFVCDIVSMWNMPFRGSAYIVLGVSPPRTGPPSDADLKGIPPDHKKDGHFYQSLFANVQTNNIPDFEYCEQEWKGKTYGMFTIFSSHGKGEPCTVQTVKNNQAYTRHPNAKIWCRKLSRNTSANEALRSNIFMWFEDKSISPSGEVYESTADISGDITYNEDRPKKSTTEAVLPIDTFLKAADNFDKKRSYCLVTNCSTKLISGRNLHSIGYVPWLKVFDFDVDSAKTGVLGASQDQLKRRRSLCVTTWMEEVRSLNHSSTEWFFPRGYQNKRESVCVEDDRQWSKRAGKKIESHCQVLVEYCLARTPLTIIVLWYSQKGDIAFLDRFMRKLEDSLGSEMHAVLCYDQIAPDEKAIVDSLQKVLRMEVIENLSLVDVCRNFEKLFSKEPLQVMICGERSEYCLPTNDKSNHPAISDVDAAWLASCLDVLYLNDPHTSGNIDESSLGQEFYRGGALSWYEIRVKRFDARRDSEQEIVSCIDKHINKAKSTLLVLNHAPGSGGSTLAKRALWEVHRMGKSPCASVKSLDNIKEVVSQVDFLADKTHLPVVLLIDGAETNVVRRIIRLLDRRTLVVLQVERQVSRMQKNTNQPDKFKLHGTVSKEEAPGIAVAFQSGCDSINNHQKLTGLARRVQAGYKHCLYEFGIAAHAYEYRGVKAYVLGYLELKPDGPLTDWQRTVAYLALITYYGYVSMPAHFFTAIGLLGKSERGTISVNMLTHNAWRFIIEEEDKGITKWRITHHVVANEILEQVLSRTGDERKQSERLSITAKRRLARLVSEFLEHAAKVKLPGREVAPPEIMKVLTATLVYRDSREVDVSQGDHPKRKPNLARLIRDIPSDYPYVERLQILKQFAESFPEDPSAWAHLGRFYGNFRPGDEDEARNCLEKAIMLRNKEILEENERGLAEHGVVSMDRKRSDVTMMKIYHMYGILQSREIARVTGTQHAGRDRNSGSNFKFDPDCMNQPNSKFHDMVEDIVKLCTSAVDHFVECRDYVLPGLEESYGFVGEVNVRLMVAEFVNENYVPNGYTGYLACEAADKGSQEFLSECFSESNRLILECHEVVPQDELTEDFFTAVNWFNMLFTGAEKAINNWHGWDTITSRRCKIAAYKMKHSKKRSSASKRVHMLDVIHSEADVKVIIDLHEQNIREAFEKGLTLNVDADMLEWLQAIRHEDFHGVYKLDQVLCFVRMWADIRKTPLSVYYLFVLNAVMGLGSKTHGIKGSSRNFSEAIRLLEDLKKVSRLSSKPRMKRDWFGIYDHQVKGIKRLIRSSKLMQSESNSKKRPWELEEKQALLEARTGTISSSRKPLVGYIDVDDEFQSSGSQQLRAFFIPKFTKVQGDRYRGQRVEFHVAFTMAHGLEAYNVSELQSYTCGQCKRDTEMSRFGKRFMYCRCGFPIRREHDSPV